jgi:folate-binding protein YgfZ
MRSPLQEEHDRAGAVTGELRGAVVPRHFGRPADEYKAAVESAAIADPGPGVRLVAGGRSPGEMIGGVITNSVPPLLEAANSSVLFGRASYACILTPKGRMITDLWVGWLGPAPEAGLLLEIPRAGADETRAHLKKFIPPRLATVEERTEGLTGILAMGPDIPDLLARSILGLRVETEDLESMEEGEVLMVGNHPSAGIRVRRSADLATPTWELTADIPTVRGAWRVLSSAGVQRVGMGVLETLRVEAGRPAFGQDMDGETIPVEAGIQTRAVDYEKGCYTGQEVIVRIRDRGHVNQHLRGLRFSEGPAVPPGTELLAPEGERVVGRVTSEADSPRAGGSIGMGYVRREIEVPGVVRAGSLDGPSVQVLELTGPRWWDFEG